MRKHRITINERTDMPQVLAGMRTACSDLGMHEQDAQVLLTEVEAAAIDFANRGGELSSIGSHFQATRVIEHGGLRVTIQASFGGGKPSLLSRVLSFLGGKR